MTPRRFSKLAWSSLSILAALGCGGRPTPVSTVASPPPAPAPPAQAASDEGPDRTRLPTPAEIADFSPPVPERWQLANGMAVYQVAQDSPLASLLLVLPRGAATDPKAKAGLSALTIDLLDEGAGGKTALELSDALQRLATDFRAGVDVDYALIGMDLLAENFEASAELLADIVRRPQLSAAEFTRRKTQRISEALASESSPSHAREVLLQQALFGDGYAGRLAFGTRSTLEKITFGDVKRHYSAIVAPEGASLVLVGRIDRADAERVLGKAFGDWRGKATAEPAAVETGRPEPGLHLVDFSGATQSSIAVARRAAPENSPEYFPGLIFSRAFGEAFTSRLNLNLREDKGYTYGARGGFRRYRNSGSFQLAANVKSEVTRQSIDEMLKELEDLCSSRPLTAEEHREAMNGLLLGYPARFERLDGVAAQYATLPIYDRALDWFSRWPDQLGAQSLDAANELARSYCNTGDYVVVVAGDLKQVEPTLAGLKLPSSVYDAQGNPVPR